MSSFGVSLAESGSRHHGESGRPEPVKPTNLGVMSEVDDPESPDSRIRPIVAELDALVASVSGVRDALAALPGLMNDWTVGEPDEAQSLVVEVLTEPGAMVGVWERLAAGRACLVLPDPSVLAELSAPPAGAHVGIRVIVGETDDRQARAAIDEAARLGIEARSLADPPSWFAVDDGDRCIYPSAWEVTRPEQLLVLHDPVAAGGFRMLFDELWRRAVPLDARIADWERLLKLLEKGLTEAEAALEMHVSERTVRRRVREVAAALGAQNLFTLGIAWAAPADSRPEPR